MKSYWDTSGLIRAYVMKQKPQGMTRSHTVSEFFCVLSGPGLAVTESCGLRETLTRRRG